MKRILGFLAGSNRKIKNVEDEGFYHGSQKGRPDDALAEIDAYYGEKKASTSRKTVEDVKHLEAKQEDLSKKAPQAEKRWQAVQEKFGEHTPQFAMPVVLIDVAVFAMVAEALMLAPGLDMMGISEPLAQKTAAFAIGAAAAVFLHFASESFDPNRFSRGKTIIARCAGVATVIFLAFFGIVRGHQTAFAAGLNDNPLARFLSDFPIITTFVFVFLTLAFPVAGALASTYGIKQLRDWKEYTQSRREAKLLPTALIHTTRQLEAKKVSLDHELKQLDESRKQARQSYLVQHERGSKLGALQLPLWKVWLRATLAALVALILCVLVVGLFSLVTLLVPIATFIATWLHFHRVRVHPTPVELSKQPKVEFRQNPQPTESIFGGQK